MRLLRQVADPGALGDEALADEFGVEAGHDAQERRLAGAVDAENADFGVRVEGEIDVLQNLLAARPRLGQALHVVDELARGHAKSLVLAEGDLAAEITGAGTGGKATSGKPQTPEVFRCA